LNEKPKRKEGKRFNRYKYSRINRYDASNWTFFDNLAGCPALLGGQVSDDG